MSEGGEGRGEVVEIKHTCGRTEFYISFASKDMSDRRNVIITCGVSDIILSSWSPFGNVSPSKNNNI